MQDYVEYSVFILFGLGFVFSLKLVSSILRIFWCLLAFPSSSLGVFLLISGL